MNVGFFLGISENIIVVVVFNFISFYKKCFFFFYSRCVCWSLDIFKFFWFLLNENNILLIIIIFNWDFRFKLRNLKFFVSFCWKTNQIQYPPYECFICIFFITLWSNGWWKFVRRRQFFFCWEQQQKQRNIEFYSKWKEEFPKNMGMSKIILILNGTIT